MAQDVFKFRERQDIKYKALIGLVTFALLAYI